MEAFLHCLPWIGMLIVVAAGIADAVSRPAHLVNVLFRHGDCWEAYYRAQDSCGLKNSLYHFQYVYVGGSWRAYVLKHPPWGCRSSNAYKVHLLGTDCRRYVCWNSPVRTLEDIKNISFTWADCIQKYIATGACFS